MWDNKSKFDVDQTSARLMHLSVLIRDHLEKKGSDADANHLRAMFDEVEDLAKFGSMAASWCATD